MAKEIERKFLIDQNKWNWEGTTYEIVQAYLVILHDKIVRVRIAGKNAFLTIKGKLNGITRDEFEYPIPIEDARELMILCEYNKIEKIRYIQIINDKKWEIDVFNGKNKGLIVAEIELESEDEEIIYPEWIVKEISDDDRYYNFNLAMIPFSKWQ